MAKGDVSKLFDAGQAAQLHGVDDNACPWPEGSEERKVYMEGKNAPLADKWVNPARMLTQEIDS